MVKFEWLLIVIVAIGPVFATKAMPSIVSRILQHTKEDNVVISPDLLRFCLLQVFAWSRGNTAKEIHTFLQLTPNIGTSDLRAIGMDTYTDIRSFVSTDIELNNEKYVPSLFDNIERVDFRYKTSVEAINNWIANKTDSKITDFITKVAKDARILTVGATAMNEMWAQSFEDGQKRFFYVKDKKGVRITRVPMMFKTGMYRTIYLKELDADIVQIQTNKTDNPAMVVILPRKLNGIDKAVKNLANIDTDILKMYGFKRKVRIVMPKFKVRFSLSFKSILLKLGVRLMFENADLGGLTAFKGKLKIDDILQTTLFQLNEDGTSFAAVAAKTEEPTSTVMFKVYRPFIFLIIFDRRIYFAGRINSFN